MDFLFLNYIANSKLVKNRKIEIKTLIEYVKLCSISKFQSNGNGMSWNISNFSASAKKKKTYEKRGNSSNNLIIIIINYKLRIKYIFG